MLQRTASIRKMEGDGCDKDVEKPLDYSLSCSMKLEASSLDPNSNIPLSSNIVEADNEKIMLSGGDSPASPILVLERNDKTASIEQDNANSSKTTEENANVATKILKLRSPQKPEMQDGIGKNVFGNNNFAESNNNSKYALLSNYYGADETQNWKRYCDTQNNTATFAVIIMGGIMLLPPGLYYGRILICICCRCKEYSLWDVPAGPFG
ncbi:unnamed protein product [Orchesella dallaii]|uniref:Brain protein I3 n=1 Tax=Orchesella dallaii TaxID=48710 RepID=A0ABP1RF60_9HEXA